MNDLDKYFKECEERLAAAKKEVKELEKILKSKDVKKFIELSRKIDKDSLKPDFRES